MEKLLTIIIPSYNMEKYLKTCCNSLIVNNALLEKIEILVINDGSKDNTSSIAHEFQNRFPNSFIVVDKENGNYGSCINKGLKIAHGKYVKVLDADDSFDTVVFEDYLRLLEKTDVDLIISDFNFVDPSGKILLSQKYPFETNKVLSPVIFPEDIVNYFAMHAVTYKVKNLKSLSYVQTEGISYTDMEWIFLPMFNVKSFVYFNKPLYLYLYGREGQTVSPEAIKKNTGQGMKVSKKIIKDYIMHKELLSEESRGYVLNKLFERCAIQYKHYLIENRSFSNISELIDFDAQLKEELPDVYEKIEGITDFNSFKYVKHWRKNYSIKTINFMLFYLERHVYILIKSCSNCIKNCLKKLLR